MRKWTVVEEALGIALVRLADEPMRGSVVQIHAGRVYSILRGDMLLNGVAVNGGAISNRGIDAVTSPRAWLTARREYRRLLRERRYDRPEPEGESAY